MVSEWSEAKRSPRRHNPVQMGTPPQLLAITVLHGKEKLELSLGCEATVRDLKQTLSETLGASVASQKIIFKGKERRDVETLAASGIKSGDKLMLMMSEAGHKEAAAAALQRAKDESRRQAAEAQKLKEAAPEESAPVRTTAADAGLVETVDEMEVDEGSDNTNKYIIRVVRGKVHYR